MRRPAVLTRRPALLLALLAASAASLAARPVTVARTDVATIVTGTVRAAGGPPLAGATVQAQGRGPAFTTAADGRYTLSIRHTADVEPAILVVRAAGYTPRELRVVLHGARVQADVELTAARGTVTVAAVDSSVGVAASAAATPAQRPEQAIPRSKSVQQGAVTGRVAVMAERAAPAASPPTGVVRMRRTTQIVDATASIRRPREPGNTEAYDHLPENEFRSPRVTPLSTFSADVDRASYTNVRRFLSSGTLPPVDAVRIEELVNYFPYDDPTPRAGGAPLRITTEVAPAPWNPRHDLVRIALRARDIDLRRAPANNLVFLIDVSGSMQQPTRLPLVKQSLALLVEQMREQDRIAIVVYAGSAGLVLPSTPGSDKQRILATLDRLEAGGSTAGGAGIRLAYDVARQNFVRGGNNRVILCTDGDFNVGASSDGEMVRLIEQRRTEGSYLTILGYGMGNYKDARLEKLSGAGNGNYAYIDDLMEARKMLVKEMGGTLVTVAKDVKLQVEFNPERVQAYRLLGYEDRLLHDEDFTNDAKDAGDVGAGHTVTALYEVVRSDVRLDVPLPGVAPLRYQSRAATAYPSDELLHVAMRYKAPDGDRSTLVTHPVRVAQRGARASESMRFSSAVAGFGMLLRHSPNAGQLSWRDVIALANGARGADEDGYRAEFVRLAETAAALAQVVAAEDADRRDHPIREYANPPRPRAVHP
jgi:Ca-activated chloride channel family protein